MTDWVWHPGLVLAAGGLLLALLRAGLLRSACQLLMPALALGLVFQVPDGAALSGRWMGLDLVVMNGDKLARLFATIFAVMALAGGLYALGQRQRFEVPAAYVYAGSAIGAALAGDLITLFVFWELMAIGSTLVLWVSPEAGARRAAQRYLLIHLFGGMLLMAGIVGHVQASGSTAFSAMTLNSPAQMLILAGFLINAGAPPLSAWLPDAYPEASYSGMVFLSAFTTKTAVYVLMRGFAGTELLIWIGLFMVFYGIVYALLENDMRRILAYSIVNQVGFMVAGIGIGTEMALNGAAAHAFTHILYKALLLMSAGSVLLVTGRRKCSELGGLFHTMPLTTLCGCIGALAISSFPLTSGFVSKSMVTQSAVDGHLLMVWLALTAASAGVFLHAGIKFPWFVFFQKDSGLRPPEPPWPMRLAMIALAALCLGLGIWPEPLYALLPHPVRYEPYTAAHVLAQLQLLLFSGLAFFLLLPFLKRTLTISLDTDWFWRRAGPSVIGWAWRHAACWDQAVRGFGLRLAQAAWQSFARRHGAQGRLSQMASIRTMAAWMLALLAAKLAIYYC